MRPSARDGCFARRSVVRGTIHRGERGRMYREAARWLGSGGVDALLAE